MIYKYPKNKLCIKKNKNKTKGKYWEYEKNKI